MAEDPNKQRRSDRIAMSIPIRVTGRDELGQDFMVESRTVILSRHGATIILKQSLKPDQDLKITLMRRSKGAAFRVVGRIGGGESDGFVYGVAQLDSTVDIWGIGFPPTSDAKRVVGRLLMECKNCKYQEVAYMNELEVQVFQANQELTRPCEKCRKATLWIAARDESAPPSPAPSGPAAAESAATPQPSTVGRRRNTRVNTRLMACVRQLGFSDEVVMTENMSRGGLCFKSNKAYVSGSPIEVAVPFAAGSANIFVPARVCHVMRKETDVIFRIGVAYVQGDELLRNP